MTEVTLDKIINAPAAEVWATWDDFANINVFNPNLKASYLINDSKPTGLGAERRCDMADGDNHLCERITDYIPGRRMEVEIYHSTLPLKSARAIVEVTPITETRANLRFTMRFTPAMGVLNVIMAPMMKRRFAGLLQKVLDENARFVEAGRLRAVA